MSKAQSLDVTVLAQVDITPGDGKPKRVVNVHELAELLTLANRVGQIVDSFGH